MNQLDALRQYTTVVADTGDFMQMGQFRPRDATTNPSLILKAVKKPDYQPLMKQVVQAHRGEPLDLLMDRLLVRFGCEILALIPGRVSTEVDARLSFDAAATVARAERLMALYEAAGVERDRVLIKIAATWEGMATRYPHQLDAALFFWPGRGLRAVGGAADLALCRPDLRLAQEKPGQCLGRSRACRGSRPWRAVGLPDLQLLQALGHPDRGDGRELSQCRADPGPGRLRPADHQP